ncbi:hypothetical protein PV327_002897 [Microctonus hyperodae]|uniref:DNA-directed primase/polymerase protein n=1 Tax=Microctonus hyperodae TaxID=165561 RepID=A0AA39KPV2_MICHY|nr:hypothetical protein PV327_002897 [Microctonus hyperodae]
MSQLSDLKQFYKQAEALDASKLKNSNSTTPLTFAFERDNRRVFIVAHPVDFWFHFNEKLPEEKCAYEVIPDGAPCLLYLDLEFRLDLNKNSNGPRMTKTLIDIICVYIKNYWGIICNETNVLNLDSTRDKKFSRHVIFRIKSTAFMNNIHVGRFIKIICADIEEYLAADGCAFHNILSYFKREHLEELIVETDKKRKLFIDTGVYTRNRQFRIYKATKWGKLSHLRLAKENKYMPIEELENKELGIFLESLISYFPDKKKMLFLEINENSKIDACKYTQYNQRKELQEYPNNQNKESLYPAIDKFILDLVHPGTIRAIKFFEESQTITYEIVGNRYCANIGRPHKSNNVYWVADLKYRCVYQKCHDQDDCPNFKSEATPFPCEINFLLSDADDDLFFDIPETSENQFMSTNTNQSF